jgi:hypothetical protein
MMRFNQCETESTRLDREDNAVSREQITMRSTIRIIKRSSEGPTTNSLPSPNHKTSHERERETAKTVKSWIAEWEERNRLVKAAAFSLVRSLETRSESPTQRLALVKG